MAILGLCSISIYAQNDTICVSGKVRCDSEPVDGCIVALLQLSDSCIISYTVSDQQGCYTLKAPVQSCGLLLKVTGFNIKRKMTRVKAESQICNIMAEKDNMVLHEVVVKAQKLWGNRDTLNYLVSAYTRAQDRTIGDVLRQLPGITIEDNNVIKYQGTPINNFYIENMDMLQGRYNLATQGIKADDVATVQVLESHEHVKALQDQMPSERAAINLKLRNKVKGTWSKTADLTAGCYHDGMLWDASVQAMYFGKNRQHLMRYSGGNTGRCDNAETVHYGITSNSGLHMVDMVKHGLPPVGYGTFGYRHGLNLNNLVKLSDSATVTCDFNYSQNISRGNSFSQTTYMLPDGTNLLLTEKISDRTHINIADLQLAYEKNTARKYINNTLSVFGRWEEGRGKIVSSRTNSFSLQDDTYIEADGTNSIAQSLHYRSIVITDKTRLVHRTKKGRGFEWTSTNSFSSTPQALSISEGMAAYQGIGLCTVSTNNGFDILRNAQSRHWTLSASAHLNVSYTSLTTNLSHPNETLAPDGDMEHLRTIIDIGPVARYVKGAFQSSLRMPIAATYTKLNNAAISGELTDDSRVRFHVSPSLSLIWKASDKFTFNANANYATSETSWRNLFTANIMGNYRSLSRYRAALNDSYSAGAQFKVLFKDLFNRLFARIEGGWNRTWSDIAYGTTFDTNAHAVIEAAYMPNHFNDYQLTLYGRKDIDWQTMQVELSLTGIRGGGDILRQSVFTSYRNTGCTLQGTLAFDIISGHRINYSATWSYSCSAYTDHAVIHRMLNQRAQLNLCLLPSRLFLNTNVSHTHNSNLSSSKKNYLFIGSGLLYKMSKKVELNLDGDNLTNIRTYKNRSLGDMEDYYMEYHLRPLSVTLTAHIYF